MISAMFTWFNSLTAGRLDSLMICVATDHNCRRPSKSVEDKEIINIRKLTKVCIATDHNCRRPGKSVKARKIMNIRKLTKVGQIVLMFLCLLSLPRPFQPYKRTSDRKFLGLRKQTLATFKVIPPKVKLTDNFLYLSQAVH